MSEQLESQDTGEQVQEASAEDRLPELENDQQEEQAATHEETKPEGEAKPDDQSTKTVPLAALHESRRKEREARDQLRAMDERVRIGEQRLQQLMELAQRGQQQMPAFDQDPASNLNARLAQIEQVRNAEQQNYMAEQQRAAAKARLQHEVGMQEADYRQTQPDYDDALAYLREDAINSMRAMGASDERIGQALEQQFGTMAWNLMQSGQNIPERVYALAKARGYQQKPAVSATDKMQMAQRGVSAARSLGSGGKPSTGLTLESLASMPADQFAEATKDDKAWRKLMGG